MRRSALATLAVTVLAGCTSPRADPDADTTVVTPTWEDEGPRVLFDEAHRNYHTAGGRYRPFVELMENDGCRVRSWRDEPLGTWILRDVDLLVIANARAERAGESAFSPAECRAVTAWVHGGGALLLIADHTPFGGAAADLAAGFGVGMSDSWTADAARADPETGNRTWLLFTRDDGGLGEHPILDGWGRGDRVDAVQTFAGQSLAGGGGSVALLLLSEQAMDYPSAADVREDANGRVAAGRAQAVALEFGSGRVVIAGEAAMLTAQHVKLSDREVEVGFQREGVDNKQLVLNMVRWLTGGPRRARSRTRNTSGRAPTLAYR